MQKDWYKIFLDLLWYYYKLKKSFIFFFKIFFLFKLISISLDWYYGFFPFIFKDRIFYLHFLDFYESILIFFSYWSNIKVFCIFFFFCIFWFFFRFGFKDYLEIDIRKRKKAQKEKELENQSKNYIYNIKIKNLYLKKKIKKINQILKKNI